MYSELEQKDAELEHAKTHHRKRDSQSILKFRIVGAFIVYMSYLAFQTLDILYLVGAGLIFSMVMDSPINFFAKRMPRGVAIFFAYFIMVIIITALLLFVLPFIFRQIADVINLATAQISHFKLLLETQGLSGIISGYSRLPSTVKNFLLENIKDQSLQMQLQQSLQQNISNIVSQGTNYATNIGSFAVNLLTGIFSTIVQIGLVLTLSVLFSIEKDSVINFISRLAGNRSAATYIKLQRLYAKLGFWLKGQLIICGYIAVMVFVLLNVIGWFGIKVPNIGSLALIAGMTNIFPYI